MPILPAGGLTSARWVSTEMLFSDPEGLDNHQPLMMSDGVSLNTSVPRRGSALTGVAGLCWRVPPTIFLEIASDHRASDIGAVELP